jgi:hypothetical protein
MSDEANVEAAPEAPAEAKPKKVKVLPKITRKFRNRESGALITVVSDPNTDTHVETVELGGKVVSVTNHAGISHGWARFDEILEKGKDK